MLSEQAVLFIGALGGTLIGACVYLVKMLFAEREERLAQWQQEVRFRRTYTAPAAAPPVASPVRGTAATRKADRIKRGE